MLEQEQLMKALREAVEAAGDPYWRQKMKRGITAGISP